MGVGGKNYPCLFTTQRGKNEHTGDCDANPGDNDQIAVAHGEAPQGGEKSIHGFACPLFYPVKGLEVNGLTREGYPGRGAFEISRRLIKYHQFDETNGGAQGGGNEEGVHSKRRETGKAHGMPGSWAPGKMCSKHTTVVERWSTSSLRAVACSLRLSELAQLPA